MNELHTQVGHFYTEHNKHLGGKQSQTVAAASEKARDSKFVFSAAWHAAGCSALAPVSSLIRTVAATMRQNDTSRLDAETMSSERIVHKHRRTLHR
jgi:hypothetical protein